MKVLHLQLRKGRNLIRLRGANLNTTSDKTLQVSRCSALWSLKNIRKNVNDKLLLDSTTITLSEGYYTFTELQTELKKHKITINRLKNNHTTLSSEKNLNLKDFGPLIGFEKAAALSKTTTHESPSPANMTNNLKEINIFCPSLVDGYKNYSLSRGEYIPSSLMLNVNIDSLQKLDGTITNFALDNTRIPLNDFSGQDLIFEVVSGGHLDDYEIRLTILIE